MADSEYYTPEEIQQIRVNLQKNTSLTASEKLQAMQELGMSDQPQAPSESSSPALTPSMPGPNSQNGEPLRPVAVQEPTGPDFWQGMGNVWNAGVRGLNQGAVELGNIIQNPGPLLNQIGHSFETEAQHNNPLAAMMIPGGEHTLGLGAGALQGTAQFFNGISGLPSMLQNAYEGKRVSQPAIQIPTGGLDQFVEKNYPVSGFVGTMAPLAAAEALTAGTATPELAAAKAGTLGGTLKAAGTGVAYGLVGTPGELEDRVKAGVNNAALGTVMHLGGKALGILPEAVSKDTTANVGLNKIRESAPAESGFKTDPVTGKLMPLEVPTTGEHGAPAEAPQGGAGVLTGRSANAEGEAATTYAKPLQGGGVSYTEERPAPWDAGEEALSPETGVSTRQPTQQHAAIADENMEAVGPSAQQDLGAMTAVDQLRQRQAQLQGQVHAVANENQEAFAPSAQQDLGAIDAVAQMKARRQEIAQQQANAEIEQEAQRVRTLLRNYELIGQKAQANKLRAEIAQKAVNDPIYQRVMQMVAPEQAPAVVNKPKVEAPALEGKVTVNLPEKPVEAINEPQGQSQQLEGQQPAQGPEEAQPVAEQKPTGKAGQEEVKSVSTESPEDIQFSQLMRELLSAEADYNHAKEDWGHFDPETKQYKKRLDEVKQKIKDAGLKEEDLHEAHRQRRGIGTGEVNVVSSGDEIGTKRAEKSGKPTFFTEENGAGQGEASSEAEPEVTGKVEFKPPHAEIDDAKTDEMIQSGLNFPDMVGVKLPDGKVQLLTGSHRYAALVKAGEPVENHVHMLQPSDLKSGDIASVQAEAAKTQDFNGLVDRLYKDANSPKLKGLLKDQTGKTDRGENGELLKTESKKKTEVDQEALDAISKPADTEKDSLLSKKQKPQGTEQREHLNPEQSHKAGNFHSVEEIEDTPEFKKAYEQLDLDTQEKLHTVADAISNGKKVITGFYNPGTKTLTGVLTKRSEHGQELYTPKGLSITKKGDIVVHGYNENGELSSRRLDRFNGEVKKTTESGYEGLYKHPSNIVEGKTFHPADAILEQVVNPILKKQIQGKPIVEADYKQAHKNLESLIQEAYDANPESMSQANVDEMLEKLPDPVKQYLRKNPCE